MVVVNLYPFRDTVARDGVTPERARANIDIGGPCLIRAAAKNYLRVASVVDPADYGALVAELERGDGCLSLDTRFRLACKDLLLHSGVRHGHRRLSGRRAVPQRCGEATRRCCHERNRAGRMRRT